MAQFSAKEKSLINSNTSGTPFSVLLVTNEKDLAILRSKCEDVDLSADKEDLGLLIERMKATLKTEEGVGLAAPQVGIQKNVILFMRIDLPDEPVVAAINPRIINHSEDTTCFEGDGCLSIPGMSGNSVRYPWIEVEYTDETGKLVRETLHGHSREGDFTAVIFQHEYDHLQGILYIDRLCE